jgi:hypothetical protein
MESQQLTNEGLNQMLLDKMIEIRGTGLIILNKTVLGKEYQLNQINSKVWSKTEEFRMNLHKKICETRKVVDCLSFIENWIDIHLFK